GQDHRRPPHHPPPAAGRGWPYRFDFHPAPSASPSADLPGLSCTQTSGARLEGGTRNKAAKGELGRGLPVGLVHGEEDGEVLLHPDEAVTGAIRTVFSRFDELGSVRQVWLWFCSEGLTFPLQSSRLSGIRWVRPTYTAIHNVLTNPAYAGAYAYGRTKQERYVDDQGRVRQRSRAL